MSSHTFPEVEKCTSSKTSLNAASEWLNKCLNNHKHCASTCSSNSGWLPTRLVDIGLEDDTKWRVVITAEEMDASSTVSYLTLSYRWGSKQATMLLSSNLSLLREESQIASLPLTFRESISVARNLGIRYLWIDCLCILQDSETDWKAEAPTMRDVYTKSVCNIAASASDDPDGGLFRERDPAAIHPGLVESTLTTGHLEDHFILSDNYWDREINNGTLHDRGWVFQERFLAPRLLYFTKRQIMWECAETQACEAFPNGIPDVEEYLGQPQGTYEWLGGWGDLVRRYSECQFTQPGDRLCAFAGVAKLFKEMTGCTYLAGVWQETLLHEMCWSTSRPSRRLSTEYRAPSWSWASIDGPVYHSTTGETSYLTSEVFVELMDVSLITTDPEGLLDAVEGCITLRCPFLTAWHVRNHNEDGTIMIKPKGGSFRPIKIDIFRPDTIDDEECFQRSGTTQLIFHNRSVMHGNYKMLASINCIVVENAPGVSGAFRRVGVFIINGSLGVRDAMDLLTSDLVEERIIKLV
ncbi:hypothetical protein CGCTS75_v000440 [Colletotrichum tropicale]|nr:hypothetical protein CGCTS75_v000440 [Colletotrichum tropicale]